MRNPAKRKVILARDVIFTNDKFFAEKLVNIYDNHDYNYIFSYETNSPETCCDGNLPDENLPNESLPMENLPVENLPEKNLPVENLPEKNMQLEFLDDSVYEETNADETICDNSSPSITPSWCQIDPGNKLSNRLRTRSEIVAPSCGCCKGKHSAKAEMAEALMVQVKEPETYRAAMNSEKAEEWKIAMHEEYQALIDNTTWKLVSPPINKSIIDNKWVYKLKYNKEGEIERYKARLVARGFTQEYSIDYEETFSSVIKFTTIRTLMSLVSAENLNVCQFDIKTAFLYGKITEDIYMKQPEGFDDGSGHVCKLIRSLYGLKQSSRCWSECFTNFIKSLGFQASKADPCLFIKNKHIKIYLAIYVDDGLIICRDKEEIEIIINHLQQRFKIKILDFTTFVGIEIKICQETGIHLNQKQYTKKILHKFNMQDCNPVSTPTDVNLNYFEDSNLNNSFPYREAVGSLLFLCIATRPDIQHAVGVVSRFLEKPMHM